MIFLLWLLQWHLCTHSRGRQVGRPLERDGGRCRASPTAQGVRNPPAVQETWVGSLDRGGRRQETGEPNLRSGPGQAPTGEQMGEVDCSELGWAKGKGAKERGGTYRQGTGWTAKACDQSSDPSLTTYWLWDLDSLLISLHFCFVVIFYLLSYVRLFCDPMDCSLPGSSFAAFSRQEYWSGLLCPPPGDLPNLGI